MSELDLGDSATTLTRALVDIPSVSGDEKALTDLVEQALRRQPELSVWRRGNVVGARTGFGRAERVILAGHLDTVPIAGNLPSRREGDRLYGCGTTDMKSGDAVALRLAGLIGSGTVEISRDVTWVFYDCEEVEAARNGLRAVVAEEPARLQGDLAVLLEPTGGVLEGGCQGTMRVLVHAHGTRAHSARSWLGVNAIHALASVLAVLADYRARVVDVDGLTYREGLNAVGISGGVAGNVIPDAATLTVNYRFAPDRDEAAALAHLQEVFTGWELEVVDSAPGARPGLDSSIAASFAAAVGGTPQAKLGWTDVARFSALGIPAVNFGPGDPNLAHTREEYVVVDLIEAAEAALLRFLTAAVPS